MSEAPARGAPGRACPCCRRAAARPRHSPSDRCAAGGHLLHGIVGSPQAGACSEVGQATEAEFALAEVRVPTVARPRLLGLSPAQTCSRDPRVISDRPSLCPLSSQDSPPRAARGAWRGSHRGGESGDERARLRRGYRGGVFPAAQGQSTAVWSGRGGIFQPLTGGPCPGQAQARTAPHSVVPQCRTGVAASSSLHLHKWEQEGSAGRQLAARLSARSVSGQPRARGQPWCSLLFALCGLVAGDREDLQRTEPHPRAGAPRRLREPLPGPPGTALPTNSTGEERGLGDTPLEPQPRRRWSWGSAAQKCPSPLWLALLPKPAASPPRAGGFLQALRCVGQPAKLYPPQGQEGRQDQGGDRAAPSPLSPSLGLLLYRRH